MSVLSGEHLRKTFGDGAAAVTVVDDVSLALEPGEVVLLLGPSGSGKTTLLSLLSGLLRPTAGTVRLDDHPLPTRPRDCAALRLREIGFVFQSFNLLPALSAEDNVAMPLRVAGWTATAARAQARLLLAMLGLAHRAGVRPGVLSGGEKQRVSIARALAPAPRVVLADEPTASLDARNGRAAVDALVDLSRQGRQACLIATHDTRLVAIADRVLAIEDGRLVAHQA